MHLGDRRDPEKDPVREHVRRVRGVLGRRAPRLALWGLLLLAAVGVGTIVGFGIESLLRASEDPDLSDPGVATAKWMVSTVGLDPGDTFVILTGIRKVNIGLPGHWLQGALSQPQRIELDIAELDYQRLAYEREMALRQGIWMPTDEDYVPVTIRYGGQTLHGSARLKGDWPDHWYGEKWSLRFKLDGDDHLDHMSEFALQAPRTRNYMDEWVFQQAIAREGLMGVAYGFVDVTINGKPMGTYAIEEAFDDGLTRYNREPPGPLLRFTDAEYFASWAATRRDMPDPYRTETLDAFGGNATEAGYSENATRSAVRLLEGWRRGETRASDAFDVDRTARFLALSDLLGNVHGNLFHNIRLYYNPVTARLEPVAHDANGGEELTVLRCLDPDPYYRLFFDDPVLTERYLEELERVSGDGYLESLFAETGTGFAENISIIYRDQPFYYFNRQPYLGNRATIRAALHPYRAVRAYVANASSAMPVVEMGASQPLPVEVTALLAGGARAVPQDGPVTLPGKAVEEPVRFQEVAFALPAGARWDPSAPAEVECRVLGTGETRRERVVSTPRLPVVADADRLLPRPPAMSNASFAVVDEAGRAVDLLPGVHRIAGPVVVPAGYTLRCGPNTRLDLVENASIVAYGPVELCGTGEDPIVVGSSDGTGRGLTVARAENTSTLAHVRFEPLAGPGDGAALTFLESPAILDHVSVTGDRTAPLVRLVGSPFTIVDSAFAGGSAPAIRAEFSRGTMTDTLVADGSGLRLSGSVAALERVRFERIDGAAVAADEESELSGSGFSCTSVGTGLSAASGSIVAVDGLSVRDADVAVSARGKESGFGPARVELRWANLSNVTAPFVRDGGGVVRLDGRDVGAA